MAQYVVMFPADDEAEWESSSEAERQVTFDTDYQFGQLLAASGGAVVGGAGLAASSGARTLRRGTGAEPVVTEGPAQESPAQLSGFFIVRCDDYDALVQAARVLTSVHPVVEIRPVTED
jgi:hypothetical protein